MPSGGQNAELKSAESLCYSGSQRHMTTPIRMMQHNKIIGSIPQSISTFVHTKSNGGSWFVKYFLGGKLIFDKVKFAFTLIA